MRLWHMVGLALCAAGCKFETAPLWREPVHAAPSQSDGVGLYPDGGSAADAGGFVDAASPAHQGIPDTDTASREPSLGTGDPVDVPLTDAATRDASSSSEPVPPLDAAVLESDAGPAPPNALRAQMLLLLKAAQLRGDDRAVAALLAQLVTQAQSGAELAQLLTPLDSDGRCALFDTVSCITTCAAVASRCSLCLTEPGCVLELMHVCSVQGPNCR